MAAAGGIQRRPCMSTQLQGGHTRARKYTHKHMQLRTQDTQGCVHVTCICTRMSHTHTHIHTLAQALMAASVL